MRVARALIQAMPTSTCSQQGAVSETCLCHIDSLAADSAPGRQYGRMYHDKQFTLTRREVPFDGMKVRAHAVKTSVNGRLNRAKSLHRQAEHLSILKV